MRIPVSRGLNDDALLRCIRGYDRALSRMNSTVVTSFFAGELPIECYQAHGSWNGFFVNHGLEASHKFSPLLNCRGKPVSSAFVLVPMSFPKSLNRAPAGFF